METPKNTMTNLRETSAAVPNQRATVSQSTEAAEQPIRSRAESEYAELDDWWQQIRLLRILPQQSSNTDPVECLMDCHNLDSSTVPRFPAISYRSGTSLPTVEVIVNGVSFMVRDNVASRLAIM